MFSVSVREPRAGLVSLAGLLAVALGTAPLVAAPAPSDRDAAVEAFLHADPDSVLAATLDTIPGAPLTLDEAWALAGDHSTDVLQAAAALDAARGAVRRERGQFDPELFADATRSGDDQPAASPFTGASVLETDRTLARGGARVTLPFGTQLEASLDATRTETNSAFASLNPEYDATGTLSLRQPLLNGFGPAGHDQLSAARRAEDAAEARYRDAVLGARNRTASAYWDLYAAERDYAVQLLVRDQARAFLEEARTRARAGMVGPEQTASAQAFLAQQELAVLDSRERLDSVSDGLAVILGIRPEGGAPRFRPVTGPPHDFPVGPVEDLVRDAVEANQELRAERATVDQYRALARGAKWNALPTLDLLGTLGGNGLSGTGRDVVFGADTLRNDLRGGFGDAFGQVRRRDYPTWSVGVELTLPLGLREGRGERDRLEAQVEVARQQLSGNERALEARVRAVHRELVNGSARLAAARTGVEASQEQVRIGIIRYRNGRTTAFELVRLGADLATAQQRYSRALVSTAKAAAELEQLTAGGYAATATP